MKKHITLLTLLLVFITFSTFILQKSKSRTVLSVISPTKITVSLENSRKTTDSVNICIDNIDVFSTDSNDDVLKHYNNIMGLTTNEVISLGYLAQEFTVKMLLNKRITIKETGKATNDCKYATIYIDGVNYNKVLLNSGFGLSQNKIGNQKKFDENLKKARNLNLVILNHHSNKYHRLDCPYGNIAHDKIIIPQNQLPNDSVPCKYCHDKEYQNKNIQQDNNNGKSSQAIIQPPLYLKRNNITAIMTDYTTKLKPDLGCTNYACKELLNLIDKSKTSIDIAIYGYREIPIITQALQRAKNRGVNIRFVYDTYFEGNRNHYKDNSIIQKLASEYKSDNIASSTQSNMLMHNKFIIFDNSIVFTGSMNLSPTGTSGYDVNSIIILNSPDIAALYSAEFNQMLSGQFHFTKEKLNTKRKFQLQDSEIEVYFSPKDKTSKRIIELINTSTSHIYIPAFLITHTDISRALINAKNRGIDIRIIIDANSVTSRNTKHALLRKNGIPVKTENYAGKLHSKSIIIDDEYFVTGSMNFTNSGDNKNDENTIIIKNRNIAQFHKNIFLYLWTKIPNKYLEHNAKPESPDSIGSCSDGIDNNFNNKTDNEEEYCKI